MMGTISFSAILAFVVICATAKKDYSGYQVVRVYPETTHHMDFLLELQSNPMFDFWSDDVGMRQVDIMVSPVANHILKARLGLRGIRTEIFIEDVQKLIDATPLSSGDRAMDWESYHRLNEIHQWMDELASANPSWVSTQIIGQSYLGNDLKVININPGNATRKFWIDGGIHAREWISSATATYIINELVQNYEDNQELADSFDWYILPVHNPDGFEYSHTDDRLWRKTLTDHDSFWGCLGADPNRNFDFHWLEAGSSSDKCSEIYAGPTAFSEPSCDVVHRFAEELNSDGTIMAYITLHSYSQLWMCPWGWSADPIDTYDEVKRVGLAGVNALEAVHGTQYEYGSSVEILYYSSGSSRDWAFGSLGVPYVFTIELRDTGNWGFLLPEEQIIPTGEETFAGIKAAAMAMLDSPALK